MYRIFVVLGAILCSFSSIQAQNKVAISKIDSLSRLFDAAKDDATKIKIMVNAPRSIGEYYKKTSQILSLYSKAIKIAEGIGDKKSALKLLGRAAYFEVYVNKDEPKGFKLYSKALSYAEEMKDYESATDLCYGISCIYEHQNFRAEMYKYLFKAIEHNQKCSGFYYKPYRWAVSFLLEDNRIDEALVISKQAVSQVDSYSIPSELKVLAYGFHYSVLKRIPSKEKEADFYKQKIIRLVGGIKTLSESNDYDFFATVCYDVEQYKLAIFFENQYLRKTDEHSQLESSKIETYRIISNSYEQLGNYPKSLEYYKKYFNAYLNTLKDITSLESGRKVIRAEGEQNLLLKEKEIEKEKLYRNISFAIAAFIVVLGAIILFFYRREQKQKRELTHLNATKDKLFAILSHDLRSPVGNLENNVMLTNWGALSQEEFIQSTQSLGQEIGQVRNMLDNVLHWSISQMGGMKPTLTTTPIFSIVETQTKLLLPNAEAKGVRIANSVASEAQFTVDANHLAIIVRNLLQNAIKFTYIGGEVSLKSFKKGEWCYLEIKDTGVGIAQDRLRKLFEINKESSQQGTAQEQGTGLGLVLVKELVEANGGAINVTSEINQGTAFVIGFRK